MVVKDLEFGPSLGESSLLPRKIVIFLKELEPFLQERSLLPMELWALPRGKFIAP